VCVGARVRACVRATARARVSGGGGVDLHLHQRLYALKNIVLNEMRVMHIMK
jgi:hypothetical protein